MFVFEQFEHVSTVTLFRLYCNIFLVYPKLEMYKYCCGKIVYFISFSTMYLNILVIISITFGAATASQFGVFQYPGSCPKVTYITDLDFNQIQGWWYRCFSTLDCSSCFHNDGQTVYAYPLNSSLAVVAMCCRKAADRNQVICSADVGTGTIRPLLSTPGMFVYESDGQAHNTVVLDASEKFLISYSCKSNSHWGHNEANDEQIYMYSRSYEDCDELETRGRSVLKKNGIPWSHVKPVRQGGSIPYTTVPKPCSRN